jgi:hypothetical protein
MPQIEVDVGEEYVKFKDVMTSMARLLKTLLGTKQKVTNFIF